MTRYDETSRSKATSHSLPRQPRGRLWDRAPSSDSIEPANCGVRSFTTSWRCRCSVSAPDGGRAARGIVAWLHGCANTLGYAHLVRALREPRRVAARSRRPGNAIVDLGRATGAHSLLALLRSTPLPRSLVVACCSCLRPLSCICAHSHDTHSHAVGRHCRGVDCALLGRARPLSAAPGAAAAPQMVKWGNARAKLYWEAEVCVPTYVPSSYLRTPTYLPYTFRTYLLCVCVGGVAAAPLSARIDAATRELYFVRRPYLGSERGPSERGRGGAAVHSCARDAGAAVVVAGPTHGECRREIVTLVDEAAWEALAHASLVAAIATV